MKSEAAHQSHRDLELGFCLGSDLQTAQRQARARHAEGGKEIARLSWQPYAPSLSARLQVMSGAVFIAGVEQMGGSRVSKLHV